MGEDKSLPASTKRRQELRRKGQVPRSQEIGAVAQVWIGLFGILFIGPILASGLAGVMSGCFKQVQLQSGVSGISYIGASWTWALYIGGFMIALAATAFFIQVSQVGLIIAEEALEPKWGKLNPLNGLKQLFSLRRAVTAIQAIVKLTIVVLFAVAAGKDLVHADVFMRPVTVMELGSFLVSIAWQIGWRVLMAAFVIAAVDYLYQIWQYERDNRMSIDEYKDEHKQQEGSPEVKRKRHQLMKRRSVRRMLEDMKDNTIVITNPTHYAIALRYKRGETPVPVMTGKGVRRIALRLREEALRQHVPIIENPPLARGLYKHGQVGEPIPELYYQAVAGILAQLFRRGYRASEAPTGFYGEAGAAEDVPGKSSGTEPHPENNGGLSS